MSKEIPQHAADHRRGSRPVEAVVFDFGGVLITPITNQLGVLAADLGTDVRTMLDVILGPHASSDHPWHRAERGEIPVAGIQDGLAPWAERRGLRLRGDEVERILAAGQYELHGALVERARELRRLGVRTGLLTNTFAEFRPTMARDLDDFEMFDVVIESFAVGSRKPERAIYVAAAAALGVDGTIVYLDDFEQNLAPATELGWTVIHVTDADRALAELDDLVGR